MKGILVQSKFILFRVVTRQQATGPKYTQITVLQQQDDGEMEQQNARRPELGPFGFLSSS
jgi:hypothetical protein